MPEDRRLAAIMFTDIVGYTALMGSDEDKAFKILRKNRNIQRPIIKKYRGEWLKEMGDGILASFHTASDAVRCAGEIQQAAKKEGIALRIGIHTGEVVFEGHDVLGDGVNVASRLEEMADEGCINISGAVYKDIKNKAGIHAEFVEEKALKNVEEPVKVYQVHCEEEEPATSNEEQVFKKNKLPYYIITVFVLVIAIVLIWQFLPSKETIPVTEISETVDIDKSIAVLPFKNLSDDQSNQHFSDGIMEGILNHLSKIKDLRVLSRTSTEKYREGSTQSPQIGKELNVSYLLEASVFKSENRIRVTAQLIDAIKDEHIWSEQYDRELKDVFEVMSDISQEVASEVKVLIAPEIKERIESIPTENLEAYDLFLKGREYHAKYSLVVLDKRQTGSAIHLYQQAIEIDPQFALPYIWLGMAYFDQTIMADFFKESYADTLKFFADKALSINPNLEEGYWLSGNYYYEKGNFEKSIEQLERALELNPNYGDAYWSLADSYKAKSDYINAIINFEKARKLKIGAIDYPNLIRYIGNVYHDISYYDKAEAAYLELLNYSLNAYFWLYKLASNNGEWDKCKSYGDKICAIDSGKSCYGFLSMWYRHTGDYMLAKKYYENSREMALDQDSPDIFRLIDYGYLLYKLNRKEEAKEIFVKQIEYSKESIRLKRFYSTGNYGGMAHYKMAAIYAFLGEKEIAYQVLHEMEQKAFSGWYTREIQVDPMFESLWDDEEFKQIIQRQEKKYAEIRAEVDRFEQEGLL